MAGEEQRRDGGTRDRIDQLVDEWHQAVAGLDRRYKRVGVLVLLALALGLASGIGSWLALRADASGERRARYQAVYSACLQRNDTAESVRDFLKQIGADARLDDIANETFETVPDCRQYAIALLGRPVPERAFDLPEIADPRASP